VHLDHQNFALRRKMRLILTTLVTFIFFGTQANADERLGYSFGTSTLNYSDSDRAEVILNNSFQGLEYVRHDRNGSGRLGFEYRSTIAESEVIQDVRLFHSSQELLVKLGYAFYGARRGSLALVPKLFFGIGANEFYFENLSENRTSNKTEETSLLELESITYPYGWEFAAELTFENVYFEAGLRKYESDFEIQYLNADIGKINQIFSGQNIPFFVTVGIKWR